MTVPGNLSSPLLATAAADGAAAAAGPIKSLRFNSGDSARLTRTAGTPSASGTWTASVWVKRSKLGSESAILGGRKDSDATQIYFKTDNTLRWYEGGADMSTDHVFRDVSAWSHFVFVKNGTTSCKIYHNGIEIKENTSSVPSTSKFNTSGAELFIGAIGLLPSGITYHGDNLLADFYFIDGLALDESSFGAFDSNGVWQAAAYSGTYGTNGFHLLDFANESGIGDDSSGNDNDFTVNNISDGESPRWFFDGSAGTKITGTIGTALGSGDFTVEMFIEKTTTNHQEALFSFGGSSCTFETDSASKVRYQSGSTYGSTIGTNTRTHLAWVRDNGKGYIYVDGTLVSPSSGITDTNNYTDTAFAIGSRPDNGEPFEGYMDNLRVVVGTAVYTSNFSVPSTPLTAVTNTKLLTLTSPTLEDTSGQSVSLTNNGVVDEAGPDKDILFDVPTNGTQSDTGAGGEVSGNYATWNPLSSSGVTLSNGNLDATNSNSATKIASSTIVPTAKCYWEVTIETPRTGAIGGIHGVNAQGGRPDQSGGAGIYLAGSGSGGGTYVNGTKTAADYSASAGDIIGFAFDPATRGLIITRNGSSVGTLTAPDTDNLQPVSALNQSVDINVNFGQRAFAYSAPSGYKALCTTNLPTPTIADGSDHFDVLTWTGDGSGSRSFTGLSFQPDFTWVKIRSQAYTHTLFDSVRGAGSNKELSTDVRKLEGYANTAAYGYLSSFNTNGFSSTEGTSDNDYFNKTGNTYVAWNWKGASSTASNTDGTITTSIRANQTAGFSIINFEGTGANSSIGHGLNAVPELVIVKDRESETGWPVWGPGFAANEWVALNNTNAKSTTDGSNYFPSAPTSSVVNLGPWTSPDEKDLIAYCFAPVAGYSAFGSYTGNGNADGPFVYTGFRPKFILQKSSSQVTNWFIYDTERDVANVTNIVIRANSPNSEGTTSNTFDILSNGFKSRSTGSSSNVSGETYIWAAFASHPFQANGGLAR